MENITTRLGNLRITIDHHDEMQTWLNNLPDNSFTNVDEFSSFLYEIEEPLKAKVREVAETELHNYFHQRGVSNDSLPTFGPLQSRKGSLILEADMVLVATASSTYSFIKAVSEMPKITGGLKDLKDRILIKLKPEINKEANKKADEIAKTFRRRDKVISSPPEPAVNVNLEIDTSPLIELISDKDNQEKDLAARAEKEHLRRRGYTDAASANGDPASLPICLDPTFHEYMEREKSEEERVENQRALLQDEIKSLQGEITAEKARVLKKKEFIKKLKNEIIDIDQNPKRYQIHSDSNRLSGKVGLIIIFPLTAFLYIFYASVMYRAFIYNPGEILTTIGSTADLSDLFKAVFDPNVFQRAYEDGPGGFLFTLFAPFLFLATGYVWFMVLREQRYYSLAVTILVVLLADVFIAYKITRLIYEFKYLTRVVARPWEVNMVLDVNFFLVIIAGFAAYIIWGTVLGFVIDAFDKLRPIKAAIKERKLKIKDSEQEIDAIEESFTEFRNDIKRNESEINQLNNSGIIDWEKALEGVFIKLNIYLMGWVQYIRGLSSNDSDIGVGNKVEGSKFEFEKFKALKQHQHNLRKKNEKS